MNAHLNDGEPGHHLFYRLHLNGLASWEWPEDSLKAFMDPFACESSFKLCYRFKTCGETAMPHFLLFFYDILLFVYKKHAFVLEYLNDQVQCSEYTPP